MSTSPDVFTVFYCWQSGPPQNHGRHLIREALDQASDRLSRDAQLPFKVEIDSDTFNETGMCDIPATILKKLEKADAVVADLTFVAKTDDDKYCSNPNVLFELGFAFRSIGPERLICVMNEKHGPRQEQIFDLAHRRHPITFTSPGESSSRNRVIDKLSNDLEAALRPIIKLGPSGAVGGDDQRRHEGQRARIEAFWESQQSKNANVASMYLCFRPSRFRERRWPDAPSLEALMRKRAFRSGNHEFPPQQRFTAAMEWGIYNDAYGNPSWALTYAGQVWLGTPFQGWKNVKMSERDRRLTPDPPPNEMLEASEWITLRSLAEWFGNGFRFAASLAGEFADGEQVEWTVAGRNLDRKWLATYESETLLDLFGPSRSPGLSRSGQSTAAEFKAGWLKHCLNCAKETCDLFSRDGRYISRENLAGLMGLQT